MGLLKVLLPAIGLEGAEDPLQQGVGRPGPSQLREVGVEVGVEVVA